LKKRTKTTTQTLVIGQQFIFADIQEPSGRDIMNPLDTGTVLQQIPLLEHGL